MSQPVISAAVPDSLQQAPLASSNTQTTSSALPMLTPIPDSQPAAKQPSTSMSLQPQPALGTPLASPRIKPPPSAGSFSHCQAGMPLWQMLGSAANLPAGMFTGKESLDLDVLAKAAVKKRKEQERQSAEAAARDSVIAQLQMRAARQAAVSALAQQYAINWLQGRVDSEAADYVREHMDIIQRLLSKEDLLPEAGVRDAQLSGIPANPTADVAAAGQATIIAAVHSAAVEQAQGLATAAVIQDPVAAATVTAAAAERAAAVVNAAVTDASNAEAAANSAAAVAALQAAAADGAAPAVVVAQAMNEAARALAAAKAKATATAEAALQAAVAQEQQRIAKKAKQQQHPYLPMAPGLGALVDYPSDEDSHMSRALTDSQTQPGGEVGQGEVSSAERRALAAQQGHTGMSQAAGQATGQASGQAVGQAHGQGQHQPACLLPMYSMDHSSSHQQASSGAEGDLQADATGSSPRAGHLAEGAGLVGADLPCSHLSGQQLGEVLDSLRELGSVHMNLSLLSGTGVLGFVDRLESCAEASIAFMAGTMARQWRCSLACHLDTVSQPWPQRHLQQATNQLLVQCANEWGLSLPPVPDATPAPSTQAFASGSKKKRKRDGWDNKKGGKGVAALLWGSGSAPEAHTLHQLSQAKQAETLEARRLKRNLQTLHSNPSTLPKPLAGPTPASAIAAPQAAAQSGLQDAAGILPPKKDANQTAAAAADAQLQLSSDQATAAGTAPQATSSAPGRAAARKLSDGVTKAAPASARGAARAPDLAVPEERATAADGGHKLAGAGQDRATDRLDATQSSGAKDTAGVETEQMSIPEAEAQPHNAGLVAAGSAEGLQADAAGPAPQPGAEGQKAKKQGKAAAAGEPKGKRKPPVVQKGTAKRQKLKQDDRSYSEEPEAAAATAPKRAKVSYADDDDEEAAISSDEGPAPAAVKSQTKAQSSKAKKASSATAPKSKSAAAQKGTGNRSAIITAGKKSSGGKAAAKTIGKKAAGKRTFSGAAAAADDEDESEDDKSMHGDGVDDKAQTGTEAADEAADPPAATPRQRQVKPKETLQVSAKQSPSQKASKPAKQQKLPFSKAAASSPKQSKGSAAAATTAASDSAAETAAAPIGKALKAKAGSDRKSAASAERVGAGKEAKLKQSKATPKTLQTQVKVQAKSAKQQKQKIVVDEGDNDGSADNSDEEKDAEASKQVGSPGQEAIDKTHVGRALAYLKEQQKAVAGSSYLQLKPVVLTTCKGTLQRLSKLPGWNRQSVRKKQFATCNEALQACLSKHKNDNAEVTKKRHKKEVSRLLGDLVAAVTGLR